MKDEHAEFSGSIPAYDRYLGPMLFQPSAEDLAARLQIAKDGAVLELACGTGILTRVQKVFVSRLGNRKYPASLTNPTGATGNLNGKYSRNSSVRVDSTNTVGR